MVGLKFPFSSIWQILWVLACLVCLIRASRDKCVDLPTINNARPATQLAPPPYDVGTNVTLKCEAGYLPDSGSTNVAICTLIGNVASWVMPSLKCFPVSCPQPPRLENGFHEGAVYTFPNNVTYKCNMGYELIGSSNRYCGPKGEWSGRTPTCIKLKCLEPSKIANGKVDVSSLEFMGKATYQCNNGYKLEGYSERFCQENKTWSNPEPRCIEIKCPIPVIPGGRVIPVSGNSPGQVMIFKCENGNVMTTVSAKCMEWGEWSSPVPECEGTTTTPSSMVSTSVSTNYVSHSTITTFPPSSESTFTVSPVTKPPEKVHKVGCKIAKKFPNGRYNVSVPANGSFPLHTYLEFICDASYKLEGKAVAVCQKTGEWDTPIPKCKKPFPTLIVVIVAVVTVLVLGILCGVIQWFRYRRRRKPQRNMGTISKARLSDARDYEETKKLGKEKAIPVTVL